MTTTVTAPHRLWRNARYLTWLVSDTSKGLAATLFAFAIPLLALVVTNDPAQAGIIGGAGMVARLILTLAGGILADRHRRIVLMLIGSLIGILLAGAFTLLALADALTFGTLLAANVLLAARSGLFDVAGERDQGDRARRRDGQGSGGEPGAGCRAAAGRRPSGRTASRRGRLAGRRRHDSLPRRRRGDGMDAAASGAPRRNHRHGGGGRRSCRAAVRRASEQRRAYRRGARRGSGRRSGPPPDTESDAGARGKTSAWAELREGFAWLFSRPDLGGVLLIITIINLGFNAAITTVMYALQQAGYSELLIGSLGAGVGAVMLVGAIVAPMLVPRIRTGVLAIAGLSGGAIGSILLSMVTEPWAIVVVLGASVLLLPALNAGMMGYFMVATPTQLLGRANSAAGVLGMGALPLAPLIAGFGLTWIGREWTILLCAALCIVAVALALGNRALRALPVEARWAEHAKQYENA